MTAFDLYEAGDVPKALEILDEGLEDAGRERTVEGHLWALRVLCKREIAEDQAEAADEELPETDWSKELLIPGSTREFKLAAGIFLSDQHAYELAEQVLEHLCASEDSEHAHICVFNLALIRERDGRPKEALEGYRETIRMAPDWPHGHLYLARCLRDCGRTDEAVEPLNEYLVLEPEDQEEWVSLAILHSNSGRYESANSAYNRASFIDPASASLNFNRGITAYRAEDSETLSRCLRQLVKHDADDWRASLLRAYLHKLDDNLWRAWESFNEAASSELLESDDEEAKECAAAHALSFVVQNEMKEQASELANRCLSTFTLSYDILFQLRRMTGLHAIEATDFGVLVKSDLTDQTAIEQLLAEDEIGPPYCFFRNYRVIAESTESAAKIAIQFEERIGGCNVEIEETTEIETVRDVYLGAWWLARELHCFSKDSLSEE